MKISIKEKAENMLLTFRRFPLVIVAAFATTVTGIYFAESHFTYGSVAFFNATNLLFLFILAIPLLLCVSILSLRNPIKPVTKLITYSAIAILLVLLFITFGNNNSGFQRYSLFLIAACIAVSLIAFIKNNEKGFRQFYILLILRLVNAVFFSAVLNIGLSLAVVAIRELFGVVWNKAIYEDISFFVFGLFNTWYFLSGIPEDFNAVDRANDEPKILKLFTQYILIPLAGIYLVILYAYGFKILFQWKLPVGLVSGLISTFSAVGIAAYLLTNPFNREDAKSWVKGFSKAFFIVLIPLLILMAVAVLTRIGEYGVTESRYYLIAVTVWLLVVSLYYIFSKKKSIKIIPLTFALTALLISFGPWGTFSVSERSQINRFMKILDNNKIIINGEIKEAKDISGNDIESLKSIINYLKTEHNLTNLLNRLQSRANIELNKPADSLKTENLLDLLKLDSTVRAGKVYIRTGNYRFDLADNDSKIIQTSGYENCFPINSGYRRESLNRKVKCGSLTLELSVNKDLNILSLTFRDSLSRFNWDLKELYNKLNSKDKASLTIEDYTLRSENSDLKIMVVFNKINGKRESSETEIYNFEALVFVKSKF